MDSYNYTFKDWLRGRIPRPKAIADDSRKDTLFYWTYVSEPPRIKESEFKEIRKEQKRVYFLMVDWQADKNLFKLEYDLDKADIYDKAEIVELEIKSVNRRLDDPELLKRVKLGKWDRLLITSDVYVEHSHVFGSHINILTGEVCKTEDIFGVSTIIPPEEKPKADLIDRLLSIDTGGLFEAHINYRYLQLLKESHNSIQKTEARIKGSWTDISKDVDRTKLAKYIEILNSGESITEGKFRFVQFIKQQFSLRTDKLAFEKACEIYQEIYDGHKTLYANLGSYYSSKSQYSKSKLL